MNSNSVHPLSNLPWIILVSGEVPFATCKGAHTSIIPIGRAYSFFRSFLPRDRIIVIASLKECLDWHELSSEIKVEGITDPTRKETLTNMWQRKKIEFFQSLNQLISEGGADYDGLDVNIDTLLTVIRGVATEKCPKVVDHSNPSKVFLSIFLLQTH